MTEEPNTATTSFIFHLSLLAPPWPMPTTWSWSHGESRISVFKFPTSDWMESEKPILRAQEGEVSRVRQETLFRSRSVLTSSHATALPKTQADYIWPTYQSSKFFVNLEFVIPTLQEEKMVLSWKHSRKLEIRGAFSVFCLFYFVFWWHVIFCLFGFYHLGLL